jgi:hypothetical protein
MLEELGYVTVEEIGGKKRYTVALNSDEKSCVWCSAESRKSLAFSGSWLNYC